MSDWTNATLAKAELKATTLEIYDRALEANFTPGEAVALCRGLVPEELAFFRVLVDYWIDSERPSKG